MKSLFSIVVLVLFSATSVPAEGGFPAVEVYKGTSRGVVLIVAQKDRKSSMAGAGSFINDRGYVVTNAHVVIDKRDREPFSVIRVFTKPDELTGDLSRDLTQRYKAAVVAYDMGLDLALLKVEDYPLDVPVIKLADPREISIGEEVVAIGHPEQGGLWSLTYGRISGQMANQSNVKGKDVFQTDTSVNRGNSGGPLLDRRGYMVGINTNIARLASDNMPITGVNFALKSSVVKQWLGGQGLTLAYGSAPVHGETIMAKAEPEVMKEDEISGESQSPGSGDRMRKEPVMEANATETKPMEEQGPEQEAEIWVDERSGQKKKYSVHKEDKEDGASDIEMRELESDMKIHQEEKEAEPSREVKKGKMPSDTILTPKNPFTFDDLFSKVEKELEDMMDDMRNAIEMQKKKSRTRSK